jgi:hypothetical protein
MLSLIIQISIVSIIFIFLVHHLLCFFKATLTVPKIKDLVNSPNTKYQHIFDTISHKNESETDTDYGLKESEYSVIDLLPSGPDTNANANSSMKDELKHFLKKQLNNDETANNTFINANTNASTNAMYSNY